jgi:hypothetical protein
MLNNYDALTNKCKNIIKSNNPSDSINKISNLKTPKGNSFGNDVAMKIYKLYSDESVKYDSKKYQNNISSYKKSVKNNVEKAKKTVNSKKSSNVKPII